jgi:phage shock protein E
MAAGRRRFTSRRADRAVQFLFAVRGRGVMLTLQTHHEEVRVSTTARLAAFPALLLIVIVVAATPVFSAAAADQPAPSAAGPTAPTTGPATAPAAVRKISIDEFDRMRKEKGVVVLDVRTPREYAEGHVAGAINLPVTGQGSEHFNDEVAKLDRGTTYLVHCARGVRSANAVNRMAKLGFIHLNDFTGGMDLWKKEGKPVEK